MNTELLDSLENYDDCKILMLPAVGVTEQKPTNIVKHMRYGFYRWNVDPLVTAYNWVTQYMYIVANIKPEIGDWFIDRNNIIGFQNGTIKPDIGHNKIVKSTNPKLQLPHPSNEFLCKFCKETEDEFNAKQLTLLP